MKTNELRTFIQDLTKNSTIFSCDFTKKDNTKRTMLCRLGVKKHLKGGELPFDPVEKGLLPVYDMQKQGYRMINLSTVTEIRSNGQVYTFGE